MAAVALVSRWLPWGWGVVSARAGVATSAEEQGRTESVRSGVVEDGRVKRLAVSALVAAVLDVLSPAAH